MSIDWLALLQPLVGEANGHFKLFCKNLEKAVFTVCATIQE